MNRTCKTCLFNINGKCNNKKSEVGYKENVSKLKGEFSCWIMSQDYICKMILRLPKWKQEKVLDRLEKNDIFYNELMGIFYKEFERKPLSPKDLDKIRTEKEIAIDLIKEYAKYYNGAEHYNTLGASVCNSINGMISSITSSAEYLNGKYVMPDEINVIQLVDLLIEVKGYEVDRKIMLYYVARKLLTRVNDLYRNLKRGILPIGIKMTMDKKGLKEYEKECGKRYEEGIKLLRSCFSKQDYIDH